MSEPPLVIKDVDTSAEELRRDTQIWRYIAVTGIVWFAFGVVFKVLETPGAVVIAGAEAISMLGLLGCRKIVERRCNSLTCFCHLFLLICMVGILLTTLGDRFGQWEAIYFLPIGILLANQTMGLRGATIWFVGVCGLLFIRYAFDQTPDQSAFIRSFVNAVIFTFAIYFFCHQSEHLVQRRTQRLTELSNNLKLQNKKIQRLAKTDPLTRLSNRYGFSEYLASRQDDTELTMLLIDFDKFKYVNDTFGHQAGDELLRQIAHRLRQSTQQDSFIVRLGGDEFCLLLSGVSCEKELLAMASHIHEKICSPYRVFQKEVVLGASIGISLYPQHSASIEELLHDADTAMYKAKFTNRNCVICDAAIRQEIQESIQLREKLAVAIKKSEFHLVYQPQVCFETGRVFGCEALIRWNCSGEMILPCKFIPALEETGGIVEVGRWVFDEACRQLQDWQSQGWRLSLSVNLSSKQFADPDLIAEVKRSIKHHDVDPTLLDFEVTETILINDFEEVIERLNQLKAIGCTVSIDDFGTGYSSLAYLKRLPIDRLKIDREFVKDFPAGDDGLVASSVVALAKALEIRVLAEGVETQEQYQFLRDCGCEEYQGYFCSPPRSADQIEQMFFRDQTVAALEVQSTDPQN